MTIESETSDALLRYLKSNQFPETEEIASASVRVGSLPNLTSGLHNARKSLEDDIRNISRQSANDIDGWISQAKQLQQDIEASRNTAREIVKEAETAKHLQNSIADSQNKLRSIESDLNLEKSLANVLKSLQSINQLLDQAEDAIKREYLLESSECLQTCELRLPNLKDLSSASCIDVLTDRTYRLHSAVLKKANLAWDDLLYFDTDTNTLRISHGSEGQESDVFALNEANVVIGVNKSALLEIGKTLSNLGKVEDTMVKFSQNLMSNIIFPCLSRVSGPYIKVEVINNSLSLIKAAAKTDSTSVIDAIRMVLEFLITTLPQPLHISLSSHLMQPLAMSLRLHWIEPSMQKELNEMQLFDNETHSLRQLAEYIQENGWFGKDVLLELIKSIPRLWIIRRKETALANVRSVCSSNVGNKTVIEKIELQKPAERGGIDENANHDWETEWPDDANDEDEVGHKSNSHNTRSNSRNELRSAKATKLNHGSKTLSEPDSNINDKEAVDDWDWENEDAKSDASESQITKQRSNLKRPHKGISEKDNGNDESTTRHVKYTITKIPDTLAEAIKHLIDDANHLSQPSLQSLSISAARIGLYSIPVLILALYRAIALMYYSRDPSGNMLLFNDITRLVHCLQSLQEKLDSGTIAKLRLEGEIKALAGFGRRVYEREMESQRLIVKDMLDTAQGFTNCASPTFALECERAINMTVDRVRTLHDQWKDVLAPSVLLQSLGSLCSTILGKLIVDIEDMSDISEDESEKLKQYCDEISKVKEIFLAEAQANGSGDMTAVYVTNWFKFQYLAEILESSLADIKYLWTEGELRLEFEADEIVDLIEALFAESDYRRKAVNEIKRSAQV